MEFRALLQRLRRDVLLQILLLGGVGLFWCHPDQAWLVVSGMPWSTLVVMAGLLTLVQVLECTGIVEQWALWIIGRSMNQRSLYRWMITTSLIASMWLTNDITLFIVIPITLHIQRILQHNLSDLLILEAMAVNIGSMWTPVGNPQNIILWQTYHPGFISFILMMSPLVCGLVLLLFGVVQWVTTVEHLQLAVHNERSIDRIWRLGVLIYPLFLICVQMQHPYMGLILITILLMLRPALLARLNMELILVFFLMFLDMGQLRRLPAIHIWLTQISSSNQSVFFWALGLSQLLSNVPATVLLVPAHAPLKALSYGVNAGGFGCAVGSLANLILLRWPGVPARLVWRFHQYSAGFLVVATVLGTGILELYS